MHWGWRKWTDTLSHWFYPITLGPSPTEQLSLVKVLKNSTFLMLILIIGIPVEWMVLDKKSPHFFAKTLKNLMIIILACPSVTRKTLFFRFFLIWIVHLDRGNIPKESFLGCVLMWYNQFWEKGDRIMILRKVKIVPLLRLSRAQDYKEIWSMDWCSTHDFVLNKQKT